MRLKITCKEASLLIIKSEEHHLGYSEKIRMNFHLFICKMCRLFKRQNKILDKALAVNNTQEQLTVSEKENLKELIK
ncbi:MAG: hypothetical protein K1X81_04535 [Bacteroidia bacterium]|nr:hypothetical protein [Bacteroidia bacterium]